MPAQSAINKQFNVTFFDVFQIQILIRILQNTIMPNLVICLTMVICSPFLDHEIPPHYLPHHQHCFYSTSTTAHFGMCFLWELQTKSAQKLCVAWWPFGDAHSYARTYIAVVCMHNNHAHVVYLPHAPEMRSCICARTKKKTPIRRAAVRETGVGRHHGGSIEGPLKPLGPLHY